MNTTRQVLAYFDDTTDAISMTVLAEQLQITQGVLQGILDYWVRKGKLREVTVDTTTCNTCGIQSSCPFIMAMPRYFERVNESTVVTLCSCDGKCG